MEVRMKSRAILVALSILGVALYLSFDGFSSSESWRHGDLTAFEQRAGETDTSSDYSPMPDSVMTGLCWHSDKGIREGLFKDVNEGIALWRERAPESVTERPATDDVAGMKRPDQAQLLRILRQLSFETTDVTPETGTVSGVLTAAGQRRQVSLDIDRTDDDDFANGQLLDIAVSTAIEQYLRRDDLGAAQHEHGIELCIRLQAVS